MPKLTVAILLGALLLAPALALGADKKPSPPKIDETKIYYGDPGNFEKPGVIKISKVFNAIPEYREAKKKDKDDPQYYILLEKANEKFYAALETAAGEDGTDLIGEVGAIKIKGKKVPNITTRVIKALPK